MSSIIVWGEEINMKLEEVEARIEKRKAELNIEDEAESLLFWVHCFYYHISDEIMDEKRDETERWGFRHSIEEHIQNLQTALYNEKWFYNPELNERARQ